MKKMKIGVIGCGMISNAYLTAATKFDILEVVGCADMNPELAVAKAEEHGIKAMTVEELLADKKIDIVINLTPPKAHFPVTTQILEAGKHAYSEKPFGINDEETAKIMALANSRKLRVGCAPDTFLGGGQQTARKLIDDGWIGTPLSGTAMVMGRGPEKWANAPFFYDIGGGPMLDLGPYYITALVNLLGPAKSVTAMTFRGAKTRKCGPGSVPPFKEYPVNVNTHQAGMVEFQCGAVITVIASFEVYKHQHNPIEIYGSQGSLVVPDPNTFGGPVKVFKPGYTEWVEAPLSHGYVENSRSIGAADMAYAIQKKRSHRASGELANHVLEVMMAFDKSSAAGKKITLKTTCERPAALPLGLEAGLLD